MEESAFSPYKTIGFVGLGLIGGSLAKTIKRVYPDTRLIAVASTEATVHVAHRDGLIDNAEMISLADFAACDVIFLCSPVMVNIEYMAALTAILPPETILSDVGSVKNDIHAAARFFELTDRFIGGHPMAGSEKIGYRYSTDRLLENAYYILTHEDDMDEERLSRFEEYIRSLGSLPLVMPPEKHDFATAAISHLPHIVAASLVNLVRDADTEDAVMKTIAAGGFRDITRISSSSPVMWQHICVTNRDEILKLLDLFQEQLDAFKSSVVFSNEDELLRLFSEAKDYRDSLTVSQSGGLPTALEFYCDLADEAGGIASIATILALQGLSIKNIGIVHNREFEQGVLRIEMYEEDAMNEAMRLLRAKNYTIYER